MLGEQFMVGEEICGAVVSIRFQEDILRWALGSVQLSCLLSSLSTGRHYDESTNTESLSPYHMNWIIVCSIWNRTACDQAVTNRIRDTFRRVWILHFLSLLADVQLIYIDSWDTFRRVWILHFFHCWQTLIDICCTFEFPSCTFSRADLTISFPRCWVSQQALPSNTRRTMTVLSEPDFLHST